jgi:Fe-S cluster assembly protein SufB
MTIEKEVTQTVETARPTFGTPLTKVWNVQKGLSRSLIEEISWQKGEPDWMRQKRLKSYEIFESKPMPSWGPDLSALKFDDLTFYTPPGSKKTRSWDEVPKDIKDTYEKLGIPEAERKYLAGVVAVYNSEAVYEGIKDEYTKRGILFASMDTAVKEYPDMVKKHFMTHNVPPTDNKFAALHGAVWSGGSFMWIPPNTKLDLPLQAYFRMEGKEEGTFEHTMLIVEEGSDAEYIEGCTAQQYSTNSLHSAVVEIFVRKGARARYTTVQNWSSDIYNLNTKRALVEEEGKMEWVGGSMGSKVTMLYPASYLIGKGASADHLNISFANKGQHKDGGAKVIHGAPYTTSNILAKSVAKDGGWAGFRGLVRVNQGAYGSKVKVRCDGLLMDEFSKNDTFPSMQIHQNDVLVEHEATVGRVSEETIFYMMSRGLSEAEAMSMVVNGFIEPVTKQLPMEYALELNRLVALEMEGSIG